jgi:hypothetical protein
MGIRPFQLLRNIGVEVFKSRGGTQEWEREKQKRKRLESGFKTEFTTRRALQRKYGAYKMKP